MFRGLWIGVGILWTAYLSSHYLLSEPSCSEIWSHNREELAKFSVGYNINKCCSLTFLPFALLPLQDTTKVAKEHLVLGVGFLLVIIIFFGVGAGSLCSIVGFVYPAFKSFEAIETKVKGDDTQWLVYWVVFAFFSIIETFSSVLLYWIPFYYALYVVLCVIRCWSWLTCQTHNFVLTMF